MQIDKPFYAVVDESGIVVGDGESNLVSSIKSLMEEELKVAKKRYGDRFGVMTVRRLVVREQAEPSLDGQLVDE